MGSMVAIIFGYGYSKQFPLKTSHTSVSLRLAIAVLINSLSKRKIKQIKAK